MNHPTVRLFAALSLSLLGAACAESSSRWISQADGTAPSVADAADCRNQAWRQAEPGLPRGQSYPTSTRRGSSADGVLADPDRYQAEDVFYAQCMRRKGFELIQLPPRSS
jgi:hypothetical protein